MYRLIYSILVLFIWPSFIFAASGDVQLLKQARAQINVVAGELQLRISQVVQEQGAVNALDSCRLQMSGISDRLSTTSGWEIRRTAINVRNPNNIPDAWEKDVLKLFEQRLAEGVDLETFEFAKVVNLDGKRVFRYMKPITMKAFCTTCHGQDVAPVVAEAIIKKYPEDQAIGYQPGELRGAFSLLKILPGEPP